MPISDPFISGLVKGIILANIAAFIVLTVFILISQEWKLLWLDGLIMVKIPLLVLMYKYWPQPLTIEE